MRPIPLRIAHLGHEYANKKALAEEEAAPPAVKLKKTPDQIAIRGWSSPVSRENLLAALGKIESGKAARQNKPADKGVFSRFKFNLPGKTVERMKAGPSVKAPAKPVKRETETNAALDLILGGHGGPQLPGKRHSHGLESASTYQEIEFVGPAAAVHHSALPKEDGDFGTEWLKGKLQGDLAGVEPTLTGALHEMQKSRA